MPRQRAALGKRRTPSYPAGSRRTERQGVDQADLGVLSRYPTAPRRLLTGDEYHRMGEVGILTEDDRVELIEGELVAMAPIGREHIAATNSLNRLMVLAVGDRAVVSVGNPV